jgi:hypothetical protein
METCKVQAFWKTIEAFMKKVIRPKQTVETSFLRRVKIKVIPVTGRRDL